MSCTSPRTSSPGHCGSSGDKGQVVFYGPPGTGKTYVARKLAGYIARGGGTVEKVQVHPSYADEDFIEGYRPRLRAGELTLQGANWPPNGTARTATRTPDLGRRRGRPRPTRT